MRPFLFSNHRDAEEVALGHRHISTWKRRVQKDVLDLPG